MDIRSNKFTFIAQLLAVSIILSWTIHLVYLLKYPPENIIFIVFHILFQTFLSTGLFITAHDSMHGTVCPNNLSINDLYGKVALYLYAAFSFKKMKANHILHHQAPVSSTDPDYTSYSKERFFSWFFSFMKNYYHWREYILMHGHVLVLLAIGNWNYPNVLVFYALPSVLSAFQLFYFGTYLPHRTHKSHHNQHNARSNDFSELISFFTCYHFGYHYEHHQYPSTPWWLLPNKRRVTLNKGVQHA